MREELIFYLREFKIDAVRLASEGGRSLNEVARQLGIRPKLLSRWRREFTPYASQATPEQAFVGQVRAMTAMWRFANSNGASPAWRWSVTSYLSHRHLRGVQGVTKKMRFQKIDELR